MSRSTIGNRRFALQDILLTLRDIAAAPILSATTTETPIQYDWSKLTYYKAIVDVGSYTGFTSGTAEWDVFIDISIDGVNYKQVGTCQAPGTAVNLEIPFEGLQIEDLVSNAMDTEATTYMRCRAVKTGTPGNFTYGVYLTC